MNHRIGMFALAVSSGSGRDDWTDGRGSIGPTRAGADATSLSSRVVCFWSARLQICQCLLATAFLLLGPQGGVGPLAFGDCFLGW